MTLDNFTIDRVYPWGRSLEEYQRMFAFSPADLHKNILACADGPASFNAEMTRRGCRVTSCDPLYRFSADEIRRRFEITRPRMIDLVESEAHRFVWQCISSPAEMARIRTAAMELFLADYPSGLAQQRYLDQSLPGLPFPDGSFELALCSNFLLLYSDEFSLEFHFLSIKEMCRVAGEVRIFPLLNMRGEKSAYLNPLLESMSNFGFDVKIEKVPYEFLRGGNQMLRVFNSRIRGTP